MVDLIALVGCKREVCVKYVSYWNMVELISWPKWMEQEIEVSNMLELSGRNASETWYACVSPADAGLAAGVGL